MVRGDKILHQCYYCANNLGFGKENILLQQGDPLDSSLFCLVGQQLVQSLKSELKVWYLDWNLHNSFKQSGNNSSW
jgi:hypothetical protein